MNPISAAVHLALCLVALWVGKKFFDWRTPFDLNHELTTADNTAVGAYFACYIAALVFVEIGALVGAGDVIVKSACNFAIQLGVAIILLQITISIVDRLIFPKVDLNKEISSKRHLGLAIIAGASCMSAGLIIWGASTGTSPTALWGIFDTVGVWAIGMVFLFLSLIVYQIVTPYDYLELTMQRDGTGQASSWATAGYLLGCGIVARVALSGLCFSDLTSNPKPLYTALIKLVVGLVLMVAVARVYADKVLLPNEKMAKEISVDKNKAAGLVAGVSYVAVSLVLCAVSTICS